MDKDKLVIHYFFYNMSFHILSFICGFLLLNDKVLFTVAAPSLVILFSVSYFFAALSFIDCVLQEEKQNKTNFFKYLCKALTFATLLCLVSSIGSYNYYVGFINV